MDLLDLILDFDPDFQEILDSEQYTYSEKILEKRIKLKITQEEYASLIGISLDRLLDLEECLLDIPIEEYRRVVSIVDSIRKETLDKVVLSKIQTLVKVTKLNAPSEDDISLNHFNTVIPEEILGESHSIDEFVLADNSNMFAAIDPQKTTLLRYEINSLERVLSLAVKEKNSITKNKFSQNQISNSDIKFTASVSESYFDKPAA